LVAAQMDPQTKEIKIRSIVIEVLTIEKQDLFQVKNHPQNFFYIIIDPYQRHVNIWFHKWVPYW